MDVKKGNTLLAKHGDSLIFLLQAGKATTQTDEQQG
jgi:hypothetical protein